MFENETPGAPAPAAPAPDSTAAKAQAEIQTFRDGTHVQAVAWRQGDRTARDYYESLLKSAYGGEQPPTVEAEQAAPEAPTEQSATELEAINAADAHEKEIGLEELDRRFGEKNTPERLAVDRDAGIVYAWMIDPDDPNEARLYDALEGEFGNNPDVVNELHELKTRLGNVVNSPRPPLSANLTPEAKQRLFDQAHTFLTQNLQGTLLLKQLEEITAKPAMQVPYWGWMVRVGQSLFTESGEPKPTLDKEDAKRAERELSQFRDGTHALTEKWKQRDPAAQAHYESLLKRTTGGK